LTEVIFKVQPKPPASATLAIGGLSVEGAVTAMSAGLGSPFEVTGAAHLPPGLEGARARTLLRIEGFDDQIRYRSGELARLMQADAPIEMLRGDAADALWRAVRDARPLAEPRGDAVWRISVAPSKAAGMLAAIRAARTCRFFMDWGGGLIWLATAETDDAGASTIRAAVKVAGGHATLVRGSDALRARIDVFEPLAAPVAKLQAGLKASFDGKGLLNAGRMYAGV
jgi:glycolate oxidase FAD binding subunit